MYSKLVRTINIKHAIWEKACRIFVKLFRDFNKYNEIAEENCDDL